MVEVIGKTINELEKVDRLTDDFMFLGCQGTATSYSTWKTTYETLKTDLREVFMDSLGTEIEDRLTNIERLIDLGDGSLYLKKNSSNEEFVNSSIKFKNVLNFNASVNFSYNTDKESASAYKIILPNNTYKNPSNNNISFTCNDNTRVATKLDITTAINNFSASSRTYKLIMDLSYAPYLTNGVAVTPYYKNSSYIYDSSHSDPHKFYRFAGIKNRYRTGTGSGNYACSDGIVFRKTNDYTGIPLTESYNNFKSLTVYYTAQYDINDADDALKMYIANISVNDLNIAKLYKEYKSLYKHKTNNTKFFDDIGDQFFICDPYTNKVYLNIKCTATFNDTFIPLIPTHTGMIIIGVFGSN